MSAKIFDRGWWQWGLLAVLLLGARGFCAAQLNPTPLSQEGAPDAGSSNQPTPPLIPLQPAEEKALYGNNNLTETQIRMGQAYLAQEVQMVKDTHKLVQLANKLNAEVASQHGSGLTPAERKEVAEIEKLAHSVRTKMQAPIPSGVFQTDPSSAASFNPR